VERCLAVLDGHTVVVIDDGSVDPRPVAEAAARHGANFFASRERRPGAARNWPGRVGTELGPS
jgi:hypothetical protein